MSVKQIVDRSATKMSDIQKYQAIGTTNWAQHAIFKMGIIIFLKSYEDNFLFKQIRTIMMHSEKKKKVNKE